MSQDEFIQCNCYGPISEEQAQTEGSSGSGLVNDACSAEAADHFTNYDASKDDALEKPEFALFYAAFMFEDDRTVNELYQAYDTDEDGNLSGTEFEEFYCANVYL